MVPNLEVSSLFPMSLLHCSAVKSQDQDHSNRGHPESRKSSSRSSLLAAPSPLSLGLCVCLEASLEVSLFSKIGKQNWVGGSLPDEMVCIPAHPRRWTLHRHICGCILLCKEDHRH